MAKRQQSDTVGGASQRQLRVGEVVRRALSEILMRGDVHEPDLAGFSITVSEVRPAPDLRRATVFVMPLGGERAEAALAALDRAKPEIRRVLGRRVELKFVPDLDFRLDRSFDRIDETRAMFEDPKVKRDLGGGEPD